MGGVPPLPTFPLDGNPERGVLGLYNPERGGVPGLYNPERGEVPGLYNAQQQAKERCQGSCLREAQASALATRCVVSASFFKKLVLTLVNMFTITTDSRVLNKNLVCTSTVLNYNLVCISESHWN